VPSFEDAALGHSRGRLPLRRGQVVMGISGAFLDRQTFLWWFVLLLADIG
jgi:hypothetical protein